MSFESLDLHTRAAREFEAKIPDEFRRLVQTDPLVNAHFQQWMHGGFDSFEKMLLTLVVHLATQNKQLFNSMVAMKFYHPGKFGLIDTQ